MVASNIQLELSESALRFVEAQCRATDQQSAAAYIVELIERERIDCALEEGLDSPSGPLVKDDIDTIKHKITDGSNKSGG